MLSEAQPGRGMEWCAPHPSYIGQCSYKEEVGVNCDASLDIGLSFDFSEKLDGIELQSPYIYGT